MNDTLIDGTVSRSVLAALMNRDVVLADFPRREEYLEVIERDFLPLDLHLALTTYLEERLGAYAFLRLGRKIGNAVIDSAFPPHITTMEAAIGAIGFAHRRHCQPVIGAMELVDQDESGVTIHVTTPYNCVLQEGFFYELANRFGAPEARVSQTACRRRGDPACLFEIRY